MPKMLTEKLKENKDFAIAGLTYITSNLNDTLLTLSRDEILEGNPIINNYLHTFGTDGLLFFKSLLIGNILLGLKAVDSISQGKYLNTRNLLYSGSILTTLGSLSWLFT